MLKCKKKAYKKSKEGKVTQERRAIKTLSEYVGTDLGKLKPSRVESGEGCEGQEERLLQVHQH